MKTKRDQEEENNTTTKKTLRPAKVPRRGCPYLDTVSRRALDFDCEKKCCESLTNFDIYACLVCGKYYQGRGVQTPAYVHSRKQDHHVFINLQTEKFYCLDNGDTYEFTDPSLDDVRGVLNPSFNMEQILQLNGDKQCARTLDGVQYLPGTIGLNNINKGNGALNVVIQSLMRVTPLRNFFLVEDNYHSSKLPLVQRYGELTRKIWHSRNFKSHVSPYEFLQTVPGEFTTKEQPDPVEFTRWLLETMHTELIRSSNGNTSIISECFGGELEVVKESRSYRKSFFVLELDLPLVQNFEDVIPKVPLQHALKKFDGETVTAGGKYSITSLPQYLVLHIQRFTKNNFFVEKNPTILSFPKKPTGKNLELKDCLPLPSNIEDDENLQRLKYNLIANVLHDGKAGEGCYKVFVERKSEDSWYAIQDLRVTESPTQLVALSEGYLQIYEHHSA